MLLRRLAGWLATWWRFGCDLVISVPREWAAVLRASEAPRVASARTRGGTLGPLPGDLARDIRIGLRSLGKARAFTAIAVLSLGVGIGANTALLAGIRAVWLESIPGVAETDRIVEPLLHRRGEAIQEWSYPDFVSVREASTPIAMLAGFKGRDAVLGTGDGSTPVYAAYVTSNYFGLLGVAPRGRAFLASEDAGPGQNLVAILSHDLWQNRLGGDPGIIGGTIHVNRTPYTVVGIGPDTFRGHHPLSHRTDLWLPLTQHPFMTGEDAIATDRGMLWLQVLGRLRPGASRAEANAALAAVFARLALEYPETNEDRTATAEAFGPIPALNRSADTIALAALIAMAGVVLLIICGNVAGMVLARSATREREMAVRMAMGSGRGRLVRQLMVEAIIVALAGGVTGVLLAIVGLRIAFPPELTAAMPGGRPRPDAAVLLLTCGLTLGTTLVFGLFPALRFSRPGLIASMKDDTGGGGRRVSRVHRTAASAQVGVALMLLVVGGLFFRSLERWDGKDPGFRPEGLLFVNLDLSNEGYADGEEGLGFIDRLREEVGALAGLSSVSVGDGAPLDLSGNYTSVADADGPDDERTVVEFTRVTEGYFETIGTPLVRGRGVERTDNVSSEPVVVITQSLADRIWPGQFALGRRLRLRIHRGERQSFTVVGVTVNVASSRATEDQPHIFLALRQQYSPRIMLVARARADAREMARPVQSAILDVDPGIAPPVVVTSSSLVARATQPQRQMAALASGLGVLALLLCAIGVYGVVAFAVTNRTREIGLRMAMGATRERVLQGVLRDAVRLAVPGLLVGALLAGAVAAAFRSMLLSVSPLDPLSFGAAAGLLFVVVLAASMVPARRASTVQPMDALRHE